MANKVLGLCDAICPEKPGNPILVIGNPKFSATMKGKRAGCPKKILEFLSRFFFVIVIDEFNSSKRCPCCELELSKF